MDFSQRDKKASMSNLLSGVVDRMLRLQPVFIENKMHNLAQKQANIRAVGVREGFQSIRARSDEMAERLGHYHRQQAALIAKRNGIEAALPDAAGECETMVIRS
jgi:hypothetical protein